MVGIFHSVRCRPGVLVGQAAPRARASTLAPSPAHHAGGRLFTMSGWDLQEWMDTWERVNTVDAYLGKQGKGDAFPRDLGRAAARNLAGSGVLDDRVVVFVGKANAQLYDWPGNFPDWGVVRSYGVLGGSRSWIPHTSGVVRTWNDRANVDRLRAHFEDLRRLTRAMAS